MSDYGRPVMTSVQAEVEMLAATRFQQLGPNYDFADYEVRAISGERGFEDEAIGALAFTHEQFGTPFTQAVSCDICGGLFVERLQAMRKHRLQCGWRKR
ncbi:hypothetical protein [Mycobacterium sp. 1465703.0]|uniref:hypothetical protein n=1 Tax=Mycobacterium sp. 1465703.0 TaxID=1834078 RepID=UPI0007FE9F27|nr:hypothetical protein [Mycobacterium sp. 1465703.0]OBI95567.1 hypothetical protein A5625_08105 [Mycobacterium sp. 1465703.0]